jgi:hypothetical protein
VVRFPYRPGDLQPAGRAETIVTGLPQGGDSTRDVVFSFNGARMFVSIGSRSNVGERPKYAPWRSDAGRALVLAFTPEGGFGRGFISAAMKIPVARGNSRPYATR